MDKSLERTESD